MAPTNENPQNDEWRDLGSAEKFQTSTLQEADLGKTKIAVSFKDGKFGVVSGVCNHVGGPLGQGRLDGDYIVCPWHNWKFHRITGEGEPGFEDDQVPRYEFQLRDSHLWVQRETRRSPAQEAARTPSAGATGGACGGAGARSRHLDDSDGRRQPALLHF